MALKKLKMPKKPKASASLETKQNWLKKAAEVKKENAKRESDKKKSKELSKKIAGFK